jgi:hypothetical protein
MTEDRNVDDTNIDLVVKGENDIPQFSVEVKYNQLSKQVSAIKDIEAEIISLKSKLTGDLFKDAETHSEIYALKLMMNPEIKNNPSLDDDECLACGS